MKFKAMWRLMTEPAPRCVAKFCWNFGWKGMGAVNRFERRRKRGVYFPAFMFVSMTNACNLQCQGCWVTPSRPVKEMDLATLDRLIETCNRYGGYFFGLLGGEPLLHKGLFEVMERHPDCYFLLFTNGTLLTQGVAARMRDLGNVSPLISVEGLESVSDVRRGGDEVFRRTMAGVEVCRRNRLVTGTATSVCRSNFDELVSEAFLDELVSRGVHYVWYYIYRPVGPAPCPELALSREQVTSLRRFIVEMRCKKPIVIVDAYWDHRGRALCPAATGIGHHVSPDGFVEPCPPLQLAGDQVGDGSGFGPMMEKSEFMREFRGMATGVSRGCVIMERPDLVAGLAVRTGAVDSSGRGTVLKELGAMAPCPSHHTDGEEIPEKSLAYRISKKYWFFGFGAYG
jgi:MoaA/NifB/PqqE/SkfB family radical SAM enzyme